MGYTWFILLVALGYIGVLFAIAYYGDKRADANRSIISNPYTYALSITVYCTAWTFYGSVGRAARTGIGFLPIYIGPTLMAALWWFVLRKILRISKVNRITSIADFIASRYGKSTLLGGLVTMIAVVGIVPYISLQLKGISTSFTVLRHYPQIVMPNYVQNVPFLGDTAFYVALLLAIFAILFGTRHLDVTEHHEGLVAAIAFESVVKLLAFLAVGVYVTYGLYGGLGDLFARTQNSPDMARLFVMQDSYGDWAWLVLLSMLAILFLPRQFQMSVVENVSERHLNKAIWLFPLYLLIINLFVLPIAFGGLLHFPNSTVDPDTFVLTVPMAERQFALATLVFIGGLSAATSMVIVATVALSTMVSNDLLMPILLQWEFMGIAKRGDIGDVLLFIRRMAIIAILLFSYIYFRLIGESQALVSIGLTSFAAVAQFAPAILGGMYWKNGTRVGALVGLTGGFIVWGYTLPIPSLVESGWLPSSFITDGPLGLTLLRPYALLGLEGLNPITHAMLWSMLVNVSGYVIGSLLSSPSVLEHSQATLFVDVFKHSPTVEQAARFWRGSASIENLRTLLSRFLGPARTDAIMADYARQRGLDWNRSLNADAEWVNFAEKQLAGTIGAASARIMIASVVKEEPLSIEEVMSILDETSQLLAYSMELEQKSRQLEEATIELRAANERLQELDHLKDEFISTVTHELRTPLTAIRAFAEILEDNPDLDPDRRHHFVSIILKESERLTRLINQVLNLSKIESGKMEWQPAPINLVEVIHEAIHTIGEAMFREKNITLELDLPASVPPVIADRDGIIQVLLNLLSNAIKFCSPQAGWIKVSLRHRDHYLRVEVSDNGPGIKPEDREIIFEKFRQVGDTLTDKPQGTGLGLPICRHIITHFNGRIWVESVPGQGATFIFVLPVAADRPRQADEAEARIPTAPDVHQL
ncbi:MAG: histidine kinase [Chloroflexi bacterium]|nr:MAG: histidine kinase [Chloroflexota bacterium]